MNIETTEQLIDGLPEKVTVSGMALTRQIFVDGKPLNPQRSQKVYNHSPDGFNWGYGGSGPAQAALSILLEFLPVPLALYFYQGFKFKVVAAFPQAQDFKVDLNLYEIIKAL